MTLLVLPIPQRLCSNCEHGFSGLTGVFCVEFNEPVENEEVARDCVVFEPINLPNATITVNGAKVSSTIETNEPTATTVESLSDEDLVAACDRLLAEQHCTLWGQHFEIISKSGRRDAAEWLAGQIRSLRVSREAKP